MADRFRIAPSRSRRFRLGVALVVLAVGSGSSIIWMVTEQHMGGYWQIAAGFAFTVSLLLLLGLMLDPDYRAARQADLVLTLANQTLECLRGGMTDEAAERICEMLLPIAPAVAVGITDRDVVRGWASTAASGRPQGNPITTAAVFDVLADGQPRTLRGNSKIGAIPVTEEINGVIIHPLYVGRKITGTLLFCYRRAGQISETQSSIVRGIANLLSTQLSAAALEEQTKLATSMELKMLQAQINPHFLFNTLNTIASLIRTDPNQARELLREFSVFYRSTLEDANDLISLEREIQQVERYFALEQARFGAERLSLQIGIEPEVYEMMVPSFMIQPLVENSVRHAMKSEGKLTISVKGRMTDEAAIIQVIDDGAGMSPEKLRMMMAPESSRGLGMAVRNVHDRMESYFGSGSSMDVESEIGEGTVVTFTLKKGPVGSFVQTDGAQSLTLQG